jgi:glutamate-ammonia-ligase adenylyltransferase
VGASRDDAHLQEIVDMKRRSEATPEGRDILNVKQGPGAIRDAEWVVQQLQMMIGPSHQRARAKSTLRAAQALREFGALTFDEERALRSGYLFLRVLEHRLQLRDERAIRVVPKDAKERAALARRMEFTGRGEAAARRLEEELEHHRAAVRLLCERLFWGWRDESEQQTEADSRAATSTQNSDLIIQNSPEAQRRLQRLAEGTSTRPLPAPLARQIRAALSDALSELPHAADPERALSNLESLCEASGNRLSLLRSLGASPRLARAVYAILGGSQRLSETLIHFPQLLDMAAQPERLAGAKTGEQARADCRDYCFAFRDRAAALRRWKARELVRIGLRDLVLDASPLEITREIADLASSCIALGVGEVGASLRPASERVAFGVIGMGKLGGGEMHYASDADVLFVYATPPELVSTHDAPLATAWAEQLMRFVGERTPEGAGFEMDARLRPEGASGALVRTVSAYVEYFEREHNGLAAWERQALTRARFVAGDASMAARLQVAIRHVAYPEQWRPEWSDELRHIKGRVENERGAKAKSADVFDVKLASGTLSDIEWSAQWLAMKHGVAHPQLQTPNTWHQLEAAESARVLEPADAEALRHAYLFLRRAELRLQITQENAPKVVKRGSPEWTRWARALFPNEPSEVAGERFEEEWKSSTQSVRQVFERVRDAL